MSSIFISYRRSDNPDATGRIYDRLVAEFGKARVFKDVDSIPLGQDFRGHLNEVVGGCAAVLAIIGPRWTDARNAAGTRRLEDADDFVRIELEAALARNIPVVPVLVAHAPIPGTADLPASLASMAFRQSIEVRPDPDFHNDATRLVVALRAMLDPDAPQPEVSSAVKAKPGRSQGWRLAFAAATLAAAALAIPALNHLRETPLPETRTEISVQTEPVIAAAAAMAMALSPDGKQIVFVETKNGVSRLMLRALAATTAQPLPGTEGGQAPFWSPDSRSIGFFTSAALKRLDLGGGAPLTLALVAYSQGGSWNAEGVILFAEPGKGLLRIAATVGATAQVLLQEQGVSYGLPKFMPDGRFMYLSAFGKAPGIYLGALDGSAPVLVTTALGAFAYHPAGWLLRWDDAQRVLTAQQFDADKAALLGAPVILAQGSGAVSTSATGLVAYWKSGIASGNRQLQWRSPTGSLLGSIGEPDGTYLSPRVAGDGRRVAVSRQESGKTPDLWLLEGELATRLTFDWAIRDPVFSPDDSQIAFGSQQPGKIAMYRKAANGEGKEQLLLKAQLFAAPTSWSGDRLLYVTLGSGTSIDLGVLSLTGEPEPQAFLASSFSEGAGEFSPDRKWVAYVSNELGRPQVYIRPFAVDATGTAAAPAGMWQVSTAGGIAPKWNKDGNVLFYLNPDGDMMAAPITFSGSAPTVGTRARLFPTRIFGGGTYEEGRQYDVALDGRFLINTVLDTAAEAAPIILVQNWNPEAGK